MLGISEVFSSSQEIDCSQEDTVAQIYKKMGRATVAKAFAVVGRMDVAKEIAQEVFLRLWRAKGRFPNERAVYAWLYKASHRAGIDYLRSAACRQERASDDITTELVDPSVQTGDLVISRDAIRKYLGKLPEREAEIFLYVVLDDMTHEEIASMLNVSTKTIQRALRKAELLFRSITDGP